MQEKIKQYDTPPPNYNLRQHATHGFSNRPSPAQIISYITIATSIAIYFSSTITIKNYPVLLGLYVVFGVVMIVSSAIATLADPTDRLVYYYKWTRHDKKIIFSPEYDKILFCQYCDSYCLSQSKHCRTCNRCVNHFDHHCMWFNNCVGEANYKYFLVSIISTFSYALVMIIHIALGSFYVDFGDNSQLVRIVCSWIIGTIMAVFAFLIINLIILHIYLIVTEQTTYQFLQRKKKEEQMQKKQQQQEIKIRQIEREKERQRKIQIQASVNQIYSSKGEGKPIQLSSEESIANTKMVFVQNQKENLQQNNKTARKNRKRKIQNDYFEEQLAKHSKKQDQQNTVRSNNQNNVTVHEEIDQLQESHEKLPTFLTKNKSIKLILSSTNAESPSRKKLEPVNL